MGTGSTDMASILICPCLPVNITHHEKLLLPFRASARSGSFCRQGSIRELQYRGRQRDRLRYQTLLRSHVMGPLPDSTVPKRR